MCGEISELYVSETRVWFFSPTITIDAVQCVCPVVTGSNCLCRRDVSGRAEPRPRQLGNFVYQKNMETDKMEGKMPDGTPLGTLVSSNCSLAVEVQVTEIYEKPSDCCCIIC